LVCICFCSAVLFLFLPPVLRLFLCPIPADRFSPSYTELLAQHRKGDLGSPAHLSVFSGTSVYCDEMALAFSTPSPRRRAVVSTSTPCSPFPFSSRVRMSCWPTFMWSVLLLRWGAPRQRPPPCAAYAGRSLFFFIVFSVPSSRPVTDQKRWSSQRPLREPFLPCWTPPTF